jgi:hypothetical protein
MENPEDELVDVKSESKESDSMRSEGWSIVGRDGKAIPLKKPEAPKAKVVSHSTLEAMEIGDMLPVADAKDRKIVSWTGDDGNTLLPRTMADSLDNEVLIPTKLRSIGPVPALPACPPVYMERWLTGMANEANRLAKVKSEGIEVITPSHVTKEATIRPIGSIPYARGGKRLVALPPGAVPTSGQEGTLFVYGSDKGVYHQTPEGQYQRVSSAQPVRRVTYHQ